MFLLVSVRHVGAHPGEHQHGVSIQISINLGKTFLRISRIWDIPLTWIFARVFLYVSPFISQFLDFIFWKVLYFILIYLNGVTLKTSNNKIQFLQILLHGRKCRRLVKKDFHWNNWATFSWYFAFLYSVVFAVFDWILVILGKVWWLVPRAFHKLLGNLLATSRIFRATLFAGFNKFLNSEKFL